MKIYKVSVHDPDEGACLSWHASLAEANKARRKAKHTIYMATQICKDARRDAGEPSHITTMQIPMTKQGLLDWLNSHFTHDNG